MFDDITFASRHGETVGDDDPLLAMFAERARLFATADRTRRAEEEIVVTLPEGVARGGVMIELPAGAEPCFFYSEEDLKRAIKKRRWYRDLGVALKGEFGEKLCEELRQIKPRPRPAPEDDVAFEKNNAAALEQFRAGTAKIAAAREASGCAALDREAGEIEREACEIQDQIFETPATSLAGVLGQLDLLRDYYDLEDAKLLDSIIAGVKRLANSGGAA
jgi:hypothetical protein